MTRDILEPILLGLGNCIVLTPIMLFRKPRKKCELRAVVTLWAATAIAVAAGMWRALSEIRHLQFNLTVTHVCVHT